MKVRAYHADITEPVFPIRGYLAYENEIVTIDNGREKRELQAVYCSAHGIVFIRAYSLKNSYETSQVKIVREGVEYIRNYQRYFAIRTLTGLAKNFADEVFSK